LPVIAAEPYFRSALAVAETLRQPGRAALLLLNLGIVLSFMGRFEEAKATDAPYEVEIVDYH